MSTPLPPEIAKLLKQRADTFEPPASCPAGVYHGLITKIEFGKSRFDRERSVATFHFALTGPTDSVPPEALEGTDLSKIKIDREFELSGDKLFLLVEFFESLGLDGTAPVEELFPEAPGKEVMIDLSCTARPTGKGFFNNIKKVVGV